MPSDLLLEIEENNKKKQEEETQKIVIRIKYLAECVKNVLKKEGATVRETKQTIEGLDKELQNAFSKVMHPHVRNTNDAPLKDLM